MAAMIARFTGSYHADCQGLHVLLHGGSPARSCLLGLRALYVEPHAFSY